MTEQNGKHASGETIVIYSKNEKFLGLMHAEQQSVTVLHLDEVGKASLPVSHHYATNSRGVAASMHNHGEW